MLGASGLDRRWLSSEGDRFDRLGGFSGCESESVRGLEGRIINQHKS
jgi:hypothetical protein